MTLSPSSKLKEFISAARLRTLPLALSSIGLGGFLAKFIGGFDASVFGLCLLTTLFLQILSNYANDYGDSIHGADSKERKGPLRAVQSGKISPREMKYAVILFSILSLISGIALLIDSILSFNYTFIFFLILGISAIAAALKYTAGSNPYGYAGFGDFFVFVFFGLVAVLGTIYLQSGYVTNIIILPASSVGFFSTAVLNINNIRDIDSDSKAGKFSVPVRIGEKKAKIYHTFLILSGLLCAIVFVILTYISVIQFLFLLSLPLFVKNLVGVWKNSKSELDPYLKQMSISTLVFVLLFGIGMILAL